MCVVCSVYYASFQVGNECEWVVCEFVYLVCLLDEIYID